MQLHVPDPAVTADKGMQLKGLKQQLLLFMLLSFISRNRCIRWNLSSRRSVRGLQMSTNHPHSGTPAAGYLAVHVTGELTKGSSDAFYKATLNNARNSILESGVSRFDLLRNVDRSNEFMLIEVYKDASAPDKHKLTQHYKDWRVAVEPFMAVPRAASKYSTVYPPTAAWDALETSSSEQLDGTSYQAHRPWMAQPFANTVQTRDTSEVVGKGGVLAHLVEYNVAKSDAEQFLSMALHYCRQSSRESAIHRIDLLANNINADAAQAHSNFVLMEMYTSAQGVAAHESAAHQQQWQAAVAPLLTQPAHTRRYTTLFPSPLYYHKRSTLVYPGEAQRYREEHVLESNSSGEWPGKKGLSSTNITAGMFGFQGPKILMGRGIAVTAVRDTCRNLKLKRPLIVTGRSGLQRNEVLWQAIFPDASTYEYREHAVCIEGEPTVEDAQAFTAFAVSKGCDSVISVGGGSSIDVGKAVAALIPNSHRDIYDFLEIIGKGLPLDNDPLPHIAVPTTSGTGSEATKNAVLKSAQHGLKVSIRHDKMFPAAAVLDPLLTLSCPPSVTAHVGLDTLCQVLEPFLCCVPNPFVDALSKEGIVRAARSLRDAVADGSNIEAREDMAVASVMGGLCLANAKLGAVHGFAAVLGGRFEHAPHGAICAALLPYVFEANAQYLHAVLIDVGAEGGIGASVLANPKSLDAMVRLARYQEASRMMTGNPAASIAEGAAWLHALMRDINIPPLAQLCPQLATIAGDKTADCTSENAELQSIITATMAASSTKGNPVLLTREQLTDILIKAL